MMRRLLEDRLAELQADLVEGEQALRELDAHREQLQVSLLRVGGAIQVLRELLAADAPVGAAPPPNGRARVSEPS